MNLKRRREEPANHERWLISYADFITLLFALFVVLYAASKADQDKMKKVAETMDKAFAKQTPGLWTDGIPSNEASPPPPSFPNQSAQETKSDASVTEQVEKLPDLKNPMSLNEIIKKLEDSLRVDLGISDLKDKVEIISDARGIILRLTAEHFFDSGSAEVKHDSRVILKNIGKILKKTNRYVRVEGHTDNGKVSSDLYPSNWELSSARASWVVRFFEKEFSFNPMQLEAAGVAENHPLASNDTEEGRAKNRRVEIIVLGQNPYGAINPTSSKQDNIK